MGGRASVTGLFAGMRRSLGGFALPFEALRLLGRTRILWAFAALPVGLAALALAAASAALVAFAAELDALLTGWMPVLEAGAWFEWIWVGPAIAGLWLLGKLLFLATAVCALVVSLALANLAASPFLDVLSRRVEETREGRVAEAQGPAGITGPSRTWGAWSDRSSAAPSSSWASARRCSR